jgi:Icc protein
MHHHPVLVNSKWIDKSILHDSDKYLKIVKDNNQIKAVFFGHIHQVFETKLDGVIFCSAPSSCYQVLPKTEMFTVEKLTPGYRIIEIGNGDISTSVCWINS